MKNKLAKINDITGATTKSKDSFYVYGLYLKGSPTPFYIGKGKGSRIFEHQKQADVLKEVINSATNKDDLPVLSDKLSTLINNNNTEFVIYKFGLTETEAFYAESTLINAFSYQLDGDKIFLTNLVSGHRTKREKATLSKDKKVKARTVDDFIENYSIEDYDVSQLKEQAIFIKINQSYSPEDSDIDLYHKTRGVWKVNKSKQNSIKYAFALYDGFCVGTYRVDDWRVAYDYNDQFPFPERDNLDEQKIVLFSNIEDLKRKEPELYNKYFKNNKTPQKSLTKWRESLFFYGDSNVPPHIKKAIGKRIINIPNKNKKSPVKYKSLKNRFSFLYNDL